jgi:hypothetical protein
MGVAGWVIVAVVVVGVVAALFGFDRYRSKGKAASGPARPTDEVFTDPTSGRQMRVWYDRRRASESTGRTRQLWR